MLTDASSRPRRAVVDAQPYFEGEDNGAEDEGQSDCEDGGASYSAGVGAGAALGGSVLGGFGSGGVGASLSASSKRSKGGSGEPIAGGGASGGGAGGGGGFTGKHGHVAVTKEQVGGLIAASGAGGGEPLSNKRIYAQLSAQDGRIEGGESTSRPPVTQTSQLLTSATSHLPRRRALPLTAPAHSPLPCPPPSRRLLEHGGAGRGRRGRGRHAQGAGLGRRRQHG